MTNRHKILLVDDEPDILELLKDVLESDYDVVTVCGAQEAVSTFKQHSFSLVITDVAMPGMSGVELAKQIVELKPGTPVLLVSGLLDPQTPEDVSFAQLNKPFRRKDLLEKVSTLIK